MMPDTLMELAYDRLRELRRLAEHEHLIAKVEAQRPRRSWWALGRFRMPGRQPDPLVGSEAAVLVRR